MRPDQDRQFMTLGKLQQETRLKAIGRTLPCSGATWLFRWGSMP